MKNTVKFTAAAMAAIMAMSFTALTASAMYTGEDIEYGEDEMHIMSTVVGGWSVPDGSVALSKNPEAKAAFRKAVKDLTGVNYQALALLGTQVVAGTNYAILCRTTVVYPDAQPEIKIMYIYEDLQGNAEITGSQTLIGEQLMGGYTANSGKLSLSRNKTVYKTYKKAMKGLTGVSYTPVAYLGSQAVAGTNYMILCRSRVVYPDAPYQWSLVTVNSDLSGKASLVDIETLELGLSGIDSEEAPADEIATQTANPWSEYKTVAEASKAAGVELFSVPEKLGSHKMSHIRAMKGLVDVRYTKGGNEICVRKGLGTDDISGDWNEYKNVTEKEINSHTVTLKSNGRGVRSAFWNDGKNSFSVFSENELSAEFMESIIAELS